MNIQIPPNLSPNSYQSFLQIGINDWGGISPMTPDFVNPEFFSFISKELRDKIAVIENEEGLVKEEYWK